MKRQKVITVALEAEASCRAGPIDGSGTGVRLPPISEGDEVAEYVMAIVAARDEVLQLSTPRVAGSFSSAPALAVSWSTR